MYVFALYDNLSSVSLLTKSRKGMQYVIYNNKKPSY
jgi:hypothetical protein